jgi:hypothetical protein
MHSLAMLALAGALIFVAAPSCASLSNSKVPSDIPRAPELRLPPQRKLATLALGLLLPLIVAVKEWPILAAPRFWSEEGSLYSTFLALPDWQALTYIYLGSYQLTYDVFVWISTKAPLPFAPAVTTYLSGLLLVVLGLQLAAVARGYQFSAIISVCLISAVAMLWQGYEISLNATNTQWIAGLSVLLVLALPADALARYPKLTAAWLLICGLSGISAVLSAPAFALRWLLERCRVFGLCLGALSVAAAVQLCMVLSHDIGARHFKIEPIRLIAAAVMQTVVDPVFGHSRATQLGQGVLDGSSVALTLIGAILIACALLAVAIVRQSRERIIVVTLVFTWPVVTLIQSIATLRSTQEQLTGWDGRYFVYGAVCFCLLLAFAARDGSRTLAIPALVALALVTPVGIWERLTNRYAGVFLRGPSWSDAARGCGSARPCELPIWPAPLKIVVTN